VSASGDPRVDVEVPKRRRPGVLRCHAGTFGTLFKNRTPDVLVCFER